MELPVELCLELLMAADYLNGIYIFLSSLSNLHSRFGTFLGGHRSRMEERYSLVTSSLGIVDAIVG